MEEAGVLELYELQYSDLMLLSSLSSPNDVSLSALPEGVEVERLESIRKTIMETLGPTGPGLLCITGVPRASILRQRLLPLARKLALLDYDHRKRILKEHNLGSDVPLKNLDRNVSSFAVQLKYSQALESPRNKLNNSTHCNSNLEPAHLDDDGVTEYQEDEFENLAHIFRELGYCMMKLGLCVAQLCDRAIGGSELEQSLLESGTAKGRLIHYHSALDNSLAKANGRSKGSTKKQANTKKKQEPFVRSEEIELCGNEGNLWQQRHYDYGIFTVLTAPMFLIPSLLSENTTMDQLSVSPDQECPYPNGHSCLQIFDIYKNNVCMAKMSPESFIVQVGESADILSRGKLRSTLHCVSRPEKFKNLRGKLLLSFCNLHGAKLFQSQIITWNTAC